MKPGGRHILLNSTPCAVCSSGFFPCSHCTRGRNSGDANPYFVYNLIAEILPVVKLKRINLTFFLLLNAHPLKGSTYTPPLQGPPPFSQCFYSSQPLPTAHPWRDGEAYFWWGVAGAWLNGLWPNPPGPPMLVPCHRIHKYLMPALSTEWRQLVRAVGKGGRQPGTRSTKPQHLKEVTDSPRMKFSGLSAHSRSPASKATLASPQKG